MSKNHGMDMYKKGDADHIAAMKEMRVMMTDPKAVKKWFETKQKEFAALREDK